MSEFYKIACEIVDEDIELQVYYHHQIYLLPEKEQESRIQNWLEEYKTAEK